MIYSKIPTDVNFWVWGYFDNLINIGKTHTYMPYHIFRGLLNLVNFLDAVDQKLNHPHDGWTKFFRDPKINHRAMISRHGYTIDERQPEHKRLLRSFDCGGLGCDQQPIDWGGIRWGKLVKQKHWNIQVGDLTIKWWTFNIDGTTTAKRRYPSR